ncbi:deazaflavin-dependent oxidoreductase (nitroreductase family) [Herbihabitans rhizosphaerae]|uniref:Deazaflavin-dependent oxidoreductase (Nitroreductase family) n=1 Tax=Herbihabitans rhizosphaerae TaxID=1872711 RepID=A0A4V2ESH7_9PSEU|nr:nitroreductase/quinone reductase family protein [Herbihabitans rhizosphaerae]RZS37613.1 deazaflavin-dependent oxidoreductase (nitroreductase family) [Herbihabitans rhizosphaerae]
MDFNQHVIDEFRASKGRVGGYFDGARLLLLTTTGARSGKRHTTPVGYLPDGGERVIVIGSAGGAPTHPAWFHNLVANPTVTVEDGIFSYEANAVVLSGEERDAVFARAVADDQGWADYEVKSGRTLPVVALYEVPGPPNVPGATSMGDGLRLIHDGFRRELEIIRTELASGGSLGAQLRINCVTLCGGLHGHHSIEDAHMLPAMAGRAPEVVARLEAEHREIAALIDELKTVLTGADSAAVLAEFDRLAKELERHLDYEEEALIPLLDG